MLAGVHSVAAALGAGATQSARVDVVAPTESRAALVQGPRGLHHGQIRHEVRCKRISKQHKPTAAARIMIDEMPEIIL